MTRPENVTPATDAARLGTESSERRSAWLREDFFDSYVRWREACEGVRLAYEHWDNTTGKDRRLAYAAYSAALDREGQAATVHADCARAVRDYNGE
jgi:hypothetical protein